jgi:hypothetical protein
LLTIEKNSELIRTVIQSYRKSEPLGDDNFI